MQGAEGHEAGPQPPCLLMPAASRKARQTAPGLGAREEAVLPWPLPGGGRRGLDLPASPRGLRLPCREPQASDFSLRSRLVFLKDICLVCVYLTIPGFPVSLGLYSFSPGMESVLKSSDVKTASYPTLRRELAEPTDAPPPDSHALLHPRRPFAFTFPEPCPGGKQDHPCLGGAGRRPHLPGRAEHRRTP